MDCSKNTIITFYNTQFVLQYYLYVESVCQTRFVVNKNTLATTTNYRVYPGEFVNSMEEYYYYYIRRRVVTI